MALIQSTRQATGGGSDITAAQNDQFDIEENFEADTLELTLSQTPWDENNIIVDYNGQVKRKGVGNDWTYTAPNTINILFADPYVTDYDSIPYFQVTYLY